MLGPGECENEQQRRGEPDATRNNKKHRHTDNLSRGHTNIAQPPYSSTRLVSMILERRIFFEAPEAGAGAGWFGCNFATESGETNNDHEVPNAVPTSTHSRTVVAIPVWFGVGRGRNFFADPVLNSLRQSVEKCGALKGYLCNGLQRRRTVSL